MATVETPPSTAAASPPAPGAQTTQLVSDIAEDAGTLITQHANLFQAEMREGLAAAKWWALAAAVGVTFLTVGTFLVFIAAVYGLFDAANGAIPLWACWLIVGGVLLLLGGVLAFVGGKYLFGVSLMPNRTIKSLSETWSWVVKRQK